MEFFDILDNLIDIDLFVEKLKICLDFFVLYDLSIGGLGFDVFKNLYEMLMILGFLLGRIFDNIDI